MNQKDKLETANLFAHEYKIGCAASKFLTHAEVDRIGEYFKFKRRSGLFSIGDRILGKSSSEQSEVGLR